MTELLKRLAPALGEDVRIVQNKWIQKATSHKLLAYLQSTDENVESLMIIVRRRDLEKIAMQLSGSEDKDIFRYRPSALGLGYNGILLQSLAGTRTKEWSASTRLPRLSERIPE